MPWFLGRKFFDEVTSASTSLPSRCLKSPQGPRVPSRPPSSDSSPQVLPVYWSSPYGSESGETDTEDSYKYDSSSLVDSLMERPRLIPWSPESTTKRHTGYCLRPVKQTLYP